MYKSLGFLATLALATSVLPVDSLLADPIVLEGSYMRTAVDDYGTLGYGNNTSPGLIYDATGTGTFDGPDWITPGTPYAGWSVTCSEASNVYNNNSTGSGSNAISGTVAAFADPIGGTVYDNAVRWTGSNASYSVMQTYYFNDDAQHINISTTITASEDLRISNSDIFLILTLSGR